MAPVPRLSLPSLVSLSIFLFVSVYMFESLLPSFPLLSLCHSHLSPHSFFSLLSSLSLPLPPFPSLKLPS